MDWLSPSLPFLAALQKLSFLAAPAKLFSFLGEEKFFLLLLPLIYWCFSRKNGARVSVLFLLSVAINSILKVALASPRPYWLDPHLFKVVEDSFGFPSGHAQNAALIWPFLAFQSRQPKVWVPLSLLLMVAIAFSRLYLGVHFPVDVIGGALIGFALLGLSHLGERHLVPFWRESPLGAKIFLTVALTFSFCGLYLMAVFFGPYKMTADYNSPSLAAITNALEWHSISSQLGALFGLLLGFALTFHKLSYGTQVSPVQKVLRFIIGVLGIAVFYIGLKSALPDDAPFRFICYALTTFWVGFGAPWVFNLLENRGSASVASPIEA